MFAIYKKEMKNAFHSVIGWVFIAVFICISSIYLNFYNMRVGSATTSYAMSDMAFLFMLLIPIITMRSIAEERHQKTDQLLLSAPISVSKIVLGKYFALLTIFLIPTAFLALVPVYLTKFGDVAFAQSFVAVLGFLLYGAAAIAVGLLISALTESIVIAAIASMGVNFIMYMMSDIIGLVTDNENILTQIFGMLDIRTPYGNLMNGYLNIPSVVYFVSLTVLFLFLTCMVIQKRRYSTSKKNAGISAMSSVTTIMCVAVFVVVNIAAASLPESMQEIDCTSQKYFSIGEESEEFCKNLEQDVTIYVLAKKADGQYDTGLDKVLNKYAAASKHIAIEYVDINYNNQFYKQYTDKVPTSNSLIVESGDCYKVIDYDDIFEYSYDYSTYSQSVSGYDAEGQITSALSYVVNDERAMVYTLTGHGELELGNNFTDAARKANVTIQDLSLTTIEAVPDDAQCIIINAPTEDINEDDAAKILDFLKDGGNLVFVTNIQAGDTPNFDSLLAFYQVSVMDGQVLEFDPDNYLQGMYNYVIPDLSYDGAVSSFYAKGTSYVFMPYAQGLQVDENLDESITVSEFMQTSDKAINKTNISSEDFAQLEEGDTEGPVTIGLSAEKTLGTDSTGAVDMETTETEEAASKNSMETDDTDMEDSDTNKTSTLYLLGSIYVFDDTTDSYISKTNSKLFAGIIGETTKVTDSIMIPVKEVSEEYLITTVQDYVITYAVGVVIIPLALVIIGFVVWIRRRRK